uniref:Uncharacterized protein n=1 Tax=Anguilla anguilla TaxID=7936 RepID=A0A0E9Q8D8_ANGAN
MVFRISTHTVFCSKQQDLDFEVLNFRQYSPRMSLCDSTLLEPLT